MSTRPGAASEAVPRVQPKGSRSGLARRGAYAWRGGPLEVGVWTPCSEGEAVNVGVWSCFRRMDDCTSCAQAGRGHYPRGCIRPFFLCAGARREVDAARVHTLERVQHVVREPERLPVQGNGGPVLTFRMPYLPRCSGRACRTLDAQKPAFAGQTYPGSYPTLTLTEVPARVNAWSWRWGCSMVEECTRLPFRV